ncbi:MAG: hypothetical protein JJU02_09350 [Cryomorphaceae bacterium]|nr:hypothetical protein [Cryomorphaceae bacterium]
MNIKLALLTICCLTLVSCRQPEKSEELMKQALDVYLFSKLDDSIKIDSSLSLTNKALELDNRNFSAWNHKTTILFRKKDVDGLIQIADKMIQLRPKKPIYLGQKAMFLELAGKPTEAKKYYAKAIEKYQNYLELDTLNFDLMIEYVGILEASGNIEKADITLNNMKKMDFEEYQLEILGLYKEQSVSKEQLLKYWSGQIEYDEIGGQ